MINIVVGSKNPVKMNAAKSGAMKSFYAQEPLNNLSTIEVFGFDVPSGVSSQPIWDEETKTGAINRAKLAFNNYIEINGHAPHFSVGLEGGVQSIGEENELECFAWIIVFDGHKFGKARTASFILPQVVRDMIINDGLELGEADDKMFNMINSKQKGGSVGNLTKGAIDRLAYYEHAAILAFIPFIWPQLYPTEL